MVHFTVPPMLKSLFANLTFPKTKTELLAYAHEQGLPDDVLVGLEAMPDHIFGSVDDLVMSWGFRSEFQAAEAPAAQVDANLIAASDEGPLPLADDDDEGEGSHGADLDRMPSA